MLRSRLLRSSPRARIAFLASAILVALVLTGGAQGRTRAADAATRDHASLTLAHAAAASDQPTGGFTPGQLHRAYGLPDRGAAHQTVAVISAYDDPHAQSDLNSFDSTFHLPTCTGRHGCLRVLNQRGKPSPRPITDPTGGQWLTESALGLEVTHALCQSCALLLVEANAADKGDLSAAARAAAGAGATVIVTAAGPLEDGSDDQFAPGFTPARAAVIAAAGDAPDGGYGYGSRLAYPATLPQVLAAGGTTLTFGRGSTPHETAWSGTVTGCSSYHAAPAWEAPEASRVGCGANRALADLSAAADPGALVHITGIDTPGGPWYVAGGTSLSAPIVAGIVGLAGSLGGEEARLVYRHAATEPAAFHDIRTGTNGSGCTMSICRAQAGFDGPTGWGTPNGLAAFLRDGGAASGRHPRLSMPVPGHGLRAGRGGVVRLPVSDGNPFAVRGRIVLRYGSSRIGSSPLSLDSLGSGATRIRLSRAFRVRLRRSGLLRVRATVTFQGPAGRAVTIVRSFPLSG